MELDIGKERSHHHHLIRKRRAKKTERKNMRINEMHLLRRIFGEKKTKELHEYLRENLRVAPM